METQLTWYGQSAFKIVTPSGKVLLVDPWLTNPVFEKAKDELAALKHVDLILVTHGHSDHVGDAVEIAKRRRAKLVATFDLADAMVKHLGYPAEAVRLVNPREVIPTHYRTFPLLTGTPEAFEDELKKLKSKAKLRVMKIGETITLSN